MKVAVAVVLALLGVAFAYDFVEMELRDEIRYPAGWTRTERTDPNSMIQLTFALQERNLEKLEEFFWKVSNPNDPIYSQYLTYDEVIALTAPEPKNVMKVYNWLRSNRVSDIKFTRGKEFIVARMTVKLAEQLIRAEYYDFQHHAGHKTMRTDRYFLPADIADLVTFVGGTVRLPTIKRMRTTQTRDFDGTVDPSYIKEAFNIPADLKGKSSQNSQAVAQFLQQYYDPNDLTSFQQQFNTSVQAVTKVVGPNDPSNPGLEASLDIEYIMGIAQNVPTWFVYTDGLHEGQEPFLVWMINMINTTNSPWVHSISYGDFEDTLSVDYMNSVNVQFQKFGSMGRSILFASGDDGVGCNNASTYFVANFPASSPYVTAVGGIYTNTGTDFEGDSISSGGFSNTFKALSYQSQAVSTYLKTAGLPPSSLFNSTGRAVPDIASFSENVYIVVGGGQTPVGGTSCAAPVVSGIISLLNDARLLKGKTTLGFLNQWLYSINSDAFTDITSGNNGDYPCNDGNGFNATVGWDPVTGRGVPNFPNLLKYALQAP